MPISCDPNDLAEAAKCFSCIPPGMQAEVQTYLLAVIAGGSLDPNVLMEAAKTFSTIPKGALPEVMAYLLCQIVNA